MSENVLKPQLESPFPFLNPYQKGDKDKFFGREDEVELLYQTAHQTNLTLVYGQSGTGKTSLIQCGLANRFHPSDWYHINIRRNDDINDSLIQSLKNHVEQRKVQKSSLKDRLRKLKTNRTTSATTISKAKNPLANSPKGLLRALYGYYLKPIYLLFDQFEELFILSKGNHLEIENQEQKKFYQTIADILRTEAYCKIIFVMREEYIARLNDFEKEVPHLFEKRVRVEPMDMKNVRNVILKSTQKFNIELADEDLPNRIIFQITKGIGRVPLPYLQVFLDRLYREARSMDEDPSRKIFDRELLNKVRGIEDVLAHFLDEQMQHPDIWDERLAWRFLQYFTSKDGTKVPRAKQDIPTDAELTQKRINELCAFFEAHRILRRLENNHFELMHDSLAAKILSSSKAWRTKMPDVVDTLDQYPHPFPGYLPYSKSLSNVFFGRNWEIKQLFDKIVNEPGQLLTLVYGQLGVGKTSLIQAGLMPRLEQLYPVKYVRCNKRFIDKPEIQDLLKNPPFQKSPFSALFELLWKEGVPAENRKVLILDQFEEFFIWVTHFLHLKSFYKHLEKLIEVHPNCDVVLVVREEYFGHLSDFENVIPTLLDNRMRISPISEEQATMVITKAARIADVDFEDTQVIENIIENVKDDTGRISLSYLQVYMNQLIG